MTAVGAYLGLDILPAPLLGNFLSETLLVHTPVDNGPRDLSRVLSLQEKGFRLGADESEDLERIARRDESRFQCVGCGVGRTLESPRT